MKQRRAELENDSVRIEDGRLVLTPLSAEEPPEGSLALQEKIARHLSRVDLLVEVDGWTGFTRHFEHGGGREPRSKDLLVHLHAAVLAQACNLGPTTMAEVAELSYRRLAWCTSPPCPRPKERNLCARTGEDRLGEPSELARRSEPADRRARPPCGRSVPNGP